MISKPQKKNLKKEKLKQNQQQKVLSIFSCSHDTFLQLNRSPKNFPNCKSCGFKLSGKTGYLSCSNTKVCYYLCSNCKVCKANHFLSKIYSLRNFEKNPLFAKNKFNCSGCKIERQVTNQGIYHCIPCQFTICIQCMSNEQKIWEDQ